MVYMNTYIQLFYQEYFVKFSAEVVMNQRIILYDI